MPIITNLDAIRDIAGNAARVDDDIAITDAALLALNSGAGDYSGMTITLTTANPTGGSKLDDLVFKGVPVTDKDTAGALYDPLNKTFIGEFTRERQDSGLTLTIRFNNNQEPVTQATVDAVMHALVYRYEDSVGPASPNTLTITVDNGLGAPDSVTTGSIDLGDFAGNNAPAIADLDATRTLTGNSVQLDADFIVSDLEFQMLGNYAGLRLFWSTTSAGDELSFAPAPGASFTVDDTDPSKGRLNDAATGLVICEFSMNSKAGGMTMSIDLVDTGEKITQERLDEILHALTYTYTGGGVLPAPVTLTLQVDDASGRLNGTITQSIVINQIAHVIDYSTGSDNNLKGDVPTVIVDVTQDRAIEDPDGLQGSPVDRKLADVTGPVGTGVAYTQSDSFMIIGTDGDDRLTGGSANDTLDGGSGLDRAGYGASKEAVTVTLDANSNGTAAGVAVGSDTLISIESVTTGGNDDAFYLENMAGRVLDGGAGRDIAIYTGSSISLSIGASVVAGGGQDQLIGIESITGSEAGDTFSITDGGTADGGYEIHGAGGSDTFDIAAAGLVFGLSIDGGDDTDTLTITIGSGETVSLAGVTISNIEFVQLYVAETYTVDLPLLAGLFGAGVQFVSWSRAGFNYGVQNTTGDIALTIYDTPTLANPNGQRSYSSVVTTYTSAGATVSQHVAYDDGSFADTSYVNGIRNHQLLTDNPSAPATGSYSTVVTDWDAAGVLAHRLTTYDNGSTLEQAYQPDGARTDIKTDVAGLFNYFTETNAFNAAGQFTGSTVVFDTGANAGNTQQYFYAVAPGVLSSTLLTDTNTNEVFSTIETVYNPAGVVTGRTTTYDNTDTFQQIYQPDGSRTEVKTDNAHLQNYVTTSTTFAASGIPTSAHDVYDNGNTADFFYFGDGKPQRNVITDTNNDEAFQTITTTFSPTVHGQAETTQYVWDDGTTWLNGSAANNTLTGTAANDIITGYGGDDTMTGGAGADTFWFNGTGWGLDVITDFQVGLDQIDLRAVSGAHPLSLSTVQSGADTLLSYTNGVTSTITLQNVLATSLVPHDILM